MSAPPLVFRSRWLPAPDPENLHARAGYEPTEPTKTLSVISVGATPSRFRPERPSPPAPEPEALAVLRARPRVLPLPPELPRRAIPADSSSCYTCRGTAFWISLAGVRICERCHPPAYEKIVARRERGAPMSPQDARTATGPARSIPPETCPPGGAA